MEAAPSSRLVSFTPREKAIAALGHLNRERGTVEGLVGDQPAKGDILDPGRDPDAVVAVPRQQNKAHQVGERSGERDDLDAQAALPVADGLT